MIVAVRVRPMSQKEVIARDFEIIQPQDKLIVSFKFNDTRLNF